MDAQKIERWFNSIKGKMQAEAEMAIGLPLAVRTKTAANTVIRGTIVAAEPLKAVPWGNGARAFWDVTIEWKGCTGIVQRKHVTVDRLPR